MVSPEPVTSDPLRSSSSDLDTTQRADRSTPVKSETSSGGSTSALAIPSTADDPVMGLLTRANDTAELRTQSVVGQRQSSNSLQPATPQTTPALPPVTQITATSQDPQLITTQQGSTSTIVLPYIPLISSSTSSLSLSSSSSPSPSSDVTRLSTSSNNESMHPSSTSPATQPSQHPIVTSQTGISSGALAGAIIATAIGIGAVTLALAIWFFRKGPGYRDGFVHSEAVSVEPKQDLRRDDMYEGVASWRKNLPAPIDDKTICRQVQTLFDQIELHVENFYQPVAPSDMFQALKTLNMSGQFPPAMAAPFEQLAPSRPSEESQKKQALSLTLMKYCLAVTVCFCLDPSEDSLLPDEFNSLPLAMKPKTKPFPHQKAQALADWRTVSAYLLPDIRTLPSYVRKRDDKVQRLVSAFEEAFHVAESAKYSRESRVQSLTQVFQSTAELGIILCSQQTELSFIWSEIVVIRDRRKLLTLAPSLIKRDGNSVQVMLEKRRVAL